MAGTANLTPIHAQLPQLIVLRSTPLAALVEKRLAIFGQIHTTDDDDVDHSMASWTAHRGNACKLARRHSFKASICHELACSDSDLASAMLSSIDLAHVPLDDVATLLSTFAKWRCRRRRGRHRI